MTFSKSYEVSVTTSTGGSVTAYSDHVNGLINCIIYASTQIASTADFTITTEDTNRTIWTESNVSASKTVAPRQATHNTSGVALTYGSTGNGAVTDKIAVANERIKFVIAQGGSAKSGTFTIITE